ncbi:aminoacylase 1-like protein 2 [Vararia minispora EC-137]|uniref:Aminoacylase 1-like protein 2 n=1 Tax=Vararia minispora EC-137 TaxID=1314806 RepID=A0ACB8QYW7_9AGAM|nr:aminoacylase 1-like protein 2 [Vararia minispora EC-137]
MTSESVAFPLWRPEGTRAEDIGPLYEVIGPGVQDNTIQTWRDEVLETIEKEMTALDEGLRKLSLDIHDHPELKFEERHAHNVLTSFMREHGFEVTEHYVLETAWKAEFTNLDGKGGRTLGVNSEMDALPGIGHACGHNLIAMAGVAVALAAKKALQVHKIPGKIVLLGTPAEEGGSGKELLLRAGAYENMDACVMCHPAPGPIYGASLSSCLAVQRLVVEYHGATYVYRLQMAVDLPVLLTPLVPHSAHAAFSPWDGRNALDSAVVAYTSISVLRQQIKPSHRVHGIIEGKDWAPNIIPDYSRMIIYSRAPTRAEVSELVPRIRSCCEAAGLATACEANFSEPSPTTYELRQNKALGNNFADVFRKYYGPIDYEFGIKDASTDFGNVTYALPGLHPGFSIPVPPRGANHTIAFTKAAASLEAHQACLNVSKALALTGVRVLADDEFFAEVRQTFEEDKSLRLSQVPG